MFIKFLEIVLIVLVAFIATFMVAAVISACLLSGRIDREEEEKSIKK